MARRLTTNQEIAGSIPASVNTVISIQQWVLSLLFCMINCSGGHFSRLLVKMLVSVDHDASEMDVGMATSYTRCGDVDRSISSSKLLGSH